MKIIDYAVKGNVVRFFLGEDDCTDYWGDDWNDAPYEHNAGTVYDRFVSGYRDMTFGFDDLVLEPCTGEFNSIWSKDDMKQRQMPCIVVVPAERAKGSWENSFRYWQGADGVKRFYFGDSMAPSIELPA